MHSFRFHHAVARWFEQTFGSPTEPQVRGWPAIQSGRHVLISAPTGSGKTLAAFLASLDSLFRQGAESDLSDETQVVYVSPLKALSNDIRKNLQEPLAGIRALLVQTNGREIDVRAEVRTGDTTAAQRQALIKKPPHILVTTPESLYLLLTSDSGRGMLRTARTLILDEIHAVVDDRRGAHLALSAERLAALTKNPLQRIGLSATQKPIEEVARFLVGTRAVDNAGNPDCEVIDIGHRRELDLAIEIPQSPLEAVMSNEVWEEIYRRLAELIRAHRTTLVFVNTRRMAERVTHHLSELLGADMVTSHHGSLSAKLRLDAEDRLKRGELKALVATASLELGIDIGTVDLVCQLGSTRSIATLLQRVGRAEHRRGGLPKGRIFPLSRDELVECSALLRCIYRGDLDRLLIPEKPLDVLAQQIVAATSTEDWNENELFELARAAWPYRNLTRDEFDSVVRMLAEGFSTKRGRRSALIHHDAVNRRVRGRRGARLTALTSGGAIPDNADYRVILEPSDTFVGTVNEDFAVESLAGDIFQLGNASWRILRINSGVVRVEDAKGQPPGIPFWLGEAPARTNEVSRAVSDLRIEIAQLIASGRDPSDWLATSEFWGAQAASLPGAAACRVEIWSTHPSAQPPDVSGRLPETTGWQPVLPRRAAEQIAQYFADTYRSLGAIPSQRTLVMERFFDESGGMQLVLHAPFGSRINRAWGLALRKRFCRSFNFELQAAATDDAIVISLGTQHSFPLEEVFRYLNSKTVRDLLVQALLDAPMFAIRWRWNATRSLAVPRFRGGAKIAAPLQRMESENLLAAVFPDQLACLEHIVGDREIPDHPLVKQTIDDCLTEAMDIDGLEEVLCKIERGEIRCVARDLPEPSPLAAEILNARPYAFLDNAPLEERRTQAVYTRRASERNGSDGLGVLDAAAIDKVVKEAWPEATNADELHDALMLVGVMTLDEVQRTANSENAEQLMSILIAESRATRLRVPTLVSTGREVLECGAAAPLSSGPEILQKRSTGAPQNAGAPRTFWIAAERVPMIEPVYPDAFVEPKLVLPDSVRGKSWQRSDAIRELVRGRMEVCGPITVSELSDTLILPPPDIDGALLALESEGFVLRGKFRPSVTEQEWCDRRLLARIHRLTIDRLRAEIQPVSVHDFYRFLFAWQRADREHRVERPEGLQSVLEQLDGCELPLAAWESAVLAARVADYDPEWLDRLCFSGRIGWGRLSAPQNPNARASAPLRTSPIALYQRENLEAWLTLSQSRSAIEFSSAAQTVFETLTSNGALFFSELVRRSSLLPSQIEDALSQLAALGFVTADSFDGLRALLVPSQKRPTFGRNIGKRRRKTNLASIEFAGRWVVLRKAIGSQSGSGAESSACDTAVEKFARVLLRRYGIVFRPLLERETLGVNWYELGRIYRRWEARGEIRGGYFVGGISGEQFALPEAIGLLRSIRKTPSNGELITLSGADPLNLQGILTPGARIAALTANRILFHDGLPIAALEAGDVRKFATANPSGGGLADAPVSDLQIETKLRVGKLRPSLRPYYK
ncbi:MAG: ATP-dependent DNA helicase [Verrucomicrobia bacterium]|nr:MAG: ATP-dependent DNA helicase [Verrucomicrobiota bacterium]